LPASKIVGPLRLFVFFQEYGGSNIAPPMQGKFSQRPDDIFPEMLSISPDFSQEVTGTILKVGREIDAEPTMSMVRR
jgi:hypothetical protein